MSIMCIQPWPILPEDLPTGSVAEIRRAVDLQLLRLDRCNCKGGLPIKP